MQSSWLFDRQRDVSGGENRKVHPEFMEANQLTLAQNMVMRADGLLETREGKTKLNTTSLGAGGILSAAVYAKEDGVNRLVTQHGTSLHAATWNGVDQISILGAAVKTGLTAASKLRSKVWRDNIILTNGSDSPFRFDGTSCTDLGGTPPKSELIAVHAGRLWLVDVANPNHVVFSGLEDYDTWSALDVIKVRDGDGDFITGISSQRGGLVITKTRSTWVLYGTNAANFRLEQLSGEIGCVSKDGLLDAGIFVGADNWYTFSINGVEPIPETHTPLLETLTPEQKAAIFSAYQPAQSRAYFAMPNGVIVVMDGKAGGITTWAGLNLGHLFAADAEGWDGGLVFADTDDGTLYTNTGEDDDGTGITSIIKTAYRDHGSVRKKVWRTFIPFLTILSEGSDYEIFTKYDIDYRYLVAQETFAGTLPNFLEWGVDYWGQAYWGNNNALSTPFYLHGARGDVISFEIKTDSRILFRGYETKYREAGAK